MSTYIQFGSGLLYVNPNAANLATNPTPSKGLTIQDITIDQAGEIKELKGQNQYPDDTAKADVKSTFKFSMGRKDFSMLNNIFNADSTAPGGTTVVPDESHAVPATPYQVTIAPANSGVFAVDLGVTFSATGIRLTKVTSVTATGQYSVNTGTGVYTFFSGDTTLVMLISYAYSQTAVGTTFQIGNHGLGYGPQFEAFIVDSYQPTTGGVYSTVRLYACKIAKVSMVNKRADYAMPELEGAYFQNAAGKVIDYFSNV